MPELSRFYSEEALFAIGTLSVIGGRLPPRATNLVVEWASLHHAELVRAWKRAQSFEPPGHIEPLP